MKPILFLLLGLSLFSGLHAQSPGTPDQKEQWNRFRGPNGTGVMEKADIPAQFGPNVNVAWKNAIGEGPSSPVIWESHIYLTAVSLAKKNVLEVLCLDRRSGKLVWSDSIEDPHPRSYFSMGSPVAPTPTADADHLYVALPTYGVICYRHDGTRAWERRFDPTGHMYGMAVSPILYGDTLIVDGGKNDSRLMALDRFSGRTAWKHSSPFFRQRWSTPIIWRRPGGDSLIALGSRRVTAFDAANGKEKWWCGGFTGEVISVPVVAEGMLFASSGQGGGGKSDWDAEKSWNILIDDYDQNRDGKLQLSEMSGGIKIPIRLELERGRPGSAFPIRPKSVNRFLGDKDLNKDRELSKNEWEAFMSDLSRKFRPALVAIRSGASGDARKTHLAWEHKKGIPEMPSPLYWRGNIYLIRTGGVLSCIKAASGKVLFMERIKADGQHVASPVAAGDKIILACRNGAVTVIEAGDTLKVLAHNEFSGEILATPALAEEHLYLRTAGMLYAIGRSK